MKKIFLLIILITSFTAQGSFNDLILKAYPIANLFNAKAKQVHVFKESKVTIQESDNTTYEGTLTLLKNGDFSLSYNNRAILFSHLHRVLVRQNRLAPSLSDELDTFIQDLAPFQEAFEQSSIGSKFFIVDTRWLWSVQMGLTGLLDHKDMPFKDQQKKDIKRSEQFLLKCMADNFNLTQSLSQTTQIRLAGTAAITALIGAGAYLLFKPCKNDIVSKNEQIIREAQPLINLLDKENHEL